MHLWHLLLICTLVETAMACPPTCVCKWKGGKQTVECVNKSLVIMPDGVDSGTQVLDLTGNNLKNLSNDQFQNLGLINLQKIYLSRCRLISIDDHAFKGLSNLVELDLSNNILVEVPELIFDDIPSLMRLSLNGNPFKRVRAFAFKDLKYLISLELSRCDLEVIEREAFYGLTALELLKLDYNSLKFISGANTLPKRLHGVSLQHNPWFCDCKLADLYSWLNTSNVSQAIEPICDGPVRLRGAPIKLLDEQELACLPDVSPTSLYLEIAEGKNVSLLCRVNAVPEARVSWRFQEHVLQNDSIVAPGVHLYYFVEEGTVEKRSELFIFNANVEDNGTFICMAENQAGRAQSNYTIRIVLKEEPILTVPKTPVEYLAAVCVAGAILLVLLITCLITCLLRSRVRKRRCRKKEKSKELALYRDGDGRASPITRSGETLSTISDACIQKSNGSIFIADQSILKMSSADMACASRMFYTSACNFTPEPNPDLINDTSKERKLGEMTARGSICSSTGHNEVEKMVSVVPCQEWVPSSISNQTGVINVPVNVCFSHFQGQDLHLAPDKFVVDASSYPTDFGLPKLNTHFPPIVPATAFYRTLPHRRHQPAAAPGVACNSRFTREAEFLTRSVQPASYEHFHSNDVRYNVEGYPKDSPSYTYTPHVSFSDTVQILGKSSDSSIESSAATAPTNTSSLSTRTDGKKEHRISISLINAAAQTQVDDLQASGTLKKPTLIGDTNGDLKLSKTPRLSVCTKNMTDSPDEGYVGEGPDTTEV